MFCGATNFLLLETTQVTWASMAALVTFLHLYSNLDSTILFASSRYLQNLRQEEVFSKRKVTAMKAVCHEGSISFGALKNCWQEEVFSGRVQEQLTRAGGQACPVPWPSCREILPEAPLSLLQPPLHHQQTSLAVMVRARPASVLSS